MLSYCWKYISKYKKELTFYLLISIISTLIAVVIPILCGILVDLMIADRDIERLVKMGCLMFALGVFKILICYWNNKFYIVIQTNAAMDISADIIHHLHKISLKELQKYDIGYLNEGINHDSNSITMFYLSLIVNAVSNGLTLILMLTILCVISVKLGCTILILVCLYVVFFLAFRSRLFVKSEEFKNARSTFFGALLEQFRNVKFIKLHSLESLYRDRLKKNFEVFFEKVLDVQQFFYLYSSVDDLLEVVVNFCIYLLGGISVIRGNMTVGGFTIILNFYQNIIASIQYFANLGKEYQDNQVSYKRLDGYLKIPEQNNGNLIPSSILTISCNNLSFSRNGNYVLLDFNATFKRGKIYCIRGENGSGKTTLIDLILGLFMGEYDGEICYDGINIEKINMRKLRQKKISVLEQDPYLLEGSPQDNIYLTEDYVDDSFSCRMIKKTIGGIEANGDGLSGGEKQKVGILRTLAKKSDLLIFDEPTSALDQESREEFFDILKELKEEKIIIFVSHDKEVNQIADCVVDI